MNYEVEQALSRKADDWKFNVVQQEVSSLKSNIDQKERDIEFLKGRIQNQSSAISQLIQIIIDGDILSETNQLHEIRQYL